MIPAEQLAYTFELQSRLGMTVENRKFHASAQIGHVHYGYARYKDHESDMIAQWHAVIQCAKHYYERHPDEAPIDFNCLAKTDKHDAAGFLIRPEVKIEQ